LDISSPAGSYGIYHIPSPAARLRKKSSFWIYSALQEAMGYIIYPALKQGLGKSQAFGYIQPCRKLWDISYTLPCSELKKNEPSIKLWDISSPVGSYGIYPALQRA
jgi:hypothetical protein